VKTSQGTNRIDPISYLGADIALWPSSLDPYPLPCEMLLDAIAAYLPSNLENVSISTFAKTTLNSFSEKRASVEKALAEVAFP
jgi:hypothetical protein